MLSFEWPWAFAALLLPPLVRMLHRVETRGGTALRVPFLAELPADGGGLRLRSLPGLPFAFLALAYLLLTTAAARPTWQGDTEQVPRTGRDLMLAVDLSRSMDETDYTLGGDVVDRLTATRSIAGRFIRGRVGDRVGLILFGENAYLQAPLTFDRKTVLTLLDEAVVGLAGEATAIGDAIGLAVKRLRDEPTKRKVLVLLTDGANTAGAIEPTRAAALARDAGIVIYSIGVGSDAETARRLFGFFRPNPGSDLDEATLRQVAETTGGRYLRARDTEELERMYRLIDEIEPVAHEGEVYRPTRQLFVWPLGAAFVAGALTALLARRTRGLS